MPRFIADFIAARPGAGQFAGMLPGILFPLVSIVGWAMNSILSTTLF